jgi:hypothetical protein
VASSIVGTLERYEHITLFLSFVSKDRFWSSTIPGDGSQSPILILSQSRLTPLGRPTHPVPRFSASCPPNRPAALCAPRLGVSKPSHQSRGFVDETSSHTALPGSVFVVGAAEPPLRWHTQLLDHLSCFLAHDLVSTRLMPQASPAVWQSPATNQKWSSSNPCLLNPPPPTPSCLQTEHQHSSFSSDGSAKTWCVSGLDSNHVYLTLGNPP